MGKTSTDLCRLIESYGYRIHHLTAGGIGARIIAADVSAQFSASNVYCTKKQT